MTPADAAALDLAAEALRGMFPGKRVHTYEVGVSLSFGLWTVSCEGSNEWYVAVRLQTPDGGYPAIATTLPSGPGYGLSQDHWAGAIRRALTLAAKRIDRAARALPVVP